MPAQSFKPVKNQSSIRNKANVNRTIIALHKKQLETSVTWYIHSMTWHSLSDYTLFTLVFVPWYKTKNTSLIHLNHVNRKRVDWSLTADIINHCQANILHWQLVNSAYINQVNCPTAKLCNWVTEQIMDFINSNIGSAFVPSLLTVIILVLLAILYKGRCSGLTKIHELENKQHKEKEPEEHDERFATGRYLCNEVDLLIIVVMQNA